MASLLDVLAVVVHKNLSIDVLSQLACTSKHFHAATSYAANKKSKQQLANEMFQFIKNKYTYDQTIVDVMPMPPAVLACTHVGSSAFTLNKVEMPLSVEITFQRPG